MKSKPYFRSAALAALALPLFNLQFISAFAQGTAFTYQGRLNDGTNPASGIYDLRFAIYDSLTNGTQQGLLVTNAATAVSNGLFTVTPDFANQFPGAARWLEIAVRANSSSSFTTLIPRQKLTPAPYAITAGNLSGSLLAAQLTSLGNTNAGGNFFVGPSGNSTTEGGNNTAIGDNAFSFNTSGSGNAANGSFALTFNTSGSYNTANGYAALYLNTNGEYNAASGAFSLYGNRSGSYNAANGYEALEDNAIGSYNTASGAGALSLNTSGNDNAAFGENALSELTTGSGNIAIGQGAGIAIATGNNNIDIGNTGFGDESGVIRIGTVGTHTKAVMNGIFGTTVASGAAVQVNANGLLGTVTSSRRFKQNIQSMADASEVLLALHPVTFQYKPDLDPEGTPQFGLIAEDVEKVDPALVLHDDKHQIYTVRYEAVNAMLLNEFLKQHRQVEDQNAKLQELSLKVDAQNSENSELKQRLAALEQFIHNRK